MRYLDRRAWPLSFLPALLLVGASPAAGQERVTTDDEWCHDHGGGDRARVCEVRERTLRPDGRIEVDASPNGGVRVEGWDRDEILLRAKVQAWADEESEAREIVERVEVAVDGTRIDSRGPRIERDGGWSVSYRLMVPRRSDLELSSTNGGITIEGVRGDLEFHTTNGGVHLTDVAGDVHGSTTNGGLHIDLAGDRWEGEGLDVRTTNGGVELEIPDGYSARLETGTTNGGMRIDFPVTLQGRIDRHLEVELGEGGRTIRAVTTNGGVTIRRS